MSLRAALPTVAALAFTGCDTAGSPDMAAAYRSAPRFDVREAQRYCSDDRVVGCQLGPAAFASPTDDGGVIIGMPTGPVVRFDSAGSRVAEYGQQGGGPGEYRRLRGAHVLPDGRVVLHDGASRRLLFAADGTPLATIIGERDEGLRASGLQVRGLTTLSDPPAAVGDSVRTEVRLLRDTAPPAVVARVPLVRLNNAMGMSQPLGYFEDRPLWAVESDSTALVASGPTLSVRRYYRDARAEVVVAGPDLGNRPVTPADIEAERKRRAPTGPIPPQMQAPLRAAAADAEARAASVHPFATDLRVLEDGTFMLRESEVQEDSVRWTLFRPDGAVLGWIRLAERATVVGGSRGRLLLITPDADDVPVVAWFALNARDE